MNIFMQRVLIPAVRGMANLGTPYVGCALCGMMDTPDGSKPWNSTAALATPKPR